MQNPVISATIDLPDWLFEQDYLIFLSLYGWLLIAQVSWAKPLGETKGLKISGNRWKWFGLFGLAQALAELAKILTFSDSFFQSFNLWPAFEMMGFGFLLDFGLRRLRRFRGKFVLPLASAAGFIVGLTQQADAIIFTRVVSIVFVVGSCLVGAKIFLIEARVTKSWQCHAVVAGIMLALVSFLLDPRRQFAAITGHVEQFSSYPYFGFSYLIVRIVAAWTILMSFWGYFLFVRIGTVSPQIERQLCRLGYRVMPIALLVIFVFGFILTNWNGSRVKASMELEYVSRSQIAALPITASLPDSVWDSQYTMDLDIWRILEKRLQALQDIGSDVLNVYIWRGDENGVKALAGEAMLGGYLRLLESAESRLLDQEGFRLGESFVLGPTILGDTAMLNISSPIIDTTTNMPAYWLGIDLSASDWLQDLGIARLQAIIITGLLVGMAIFFIYYQIGHESEGDLRLAKERAEAGDRAKSEFLAVISHEIRTPLQSVLGYSDLLRSTPLNQKQQTCLDTIQSEGKILLRIVQDILDFSNLRKASHELKTSRVNLQELIEETYRTIKPMAEGKGLEAELEIGNDLPDVIETDSVRLRQVLLNLFGNSVKYTEKGSVKLSIFRGSDEVSRRRDPDHFPIDFVITDTGVGIKEKDLGRLFEPFIQLDHSGHFPREGAGLGLAIVSRIVELMKGKIGVTSEVGVGSKFRASFAFPSYESEGVDAEETEVLQVEDSTLLGHRFPLRVLAADDNPMVRNLVAQYLESLGFEPVVVDGGRPASEMGAEFDLVVIDIRMPDIDGPKAAEIIRRNSGQSERPWIIGASATLAEAEIERASKLGINTFLGKPFFAEALGKKILEIPWLAEKEFEEMSGPQEEPTPEPEPEEEPAKPSVTGGGMGMFSQDLIDAAAQEVLEIHEKMGQALSVGNYAFVSERAHYIANTAMAIGIDDLYMDSKALEVAANDENSSECDKQMERLILNFTAWREAD